MRLSFIPLFTGTGHYLLKVLNASTAFETSRKHCICKEIVRDDREEKAPSNCSCHAGFSALLTPAPAAANTGYGYSLAGEGTGCMLWPSLNSCFAAARATSFKDKQDGSRAQLILKMDFAVRWGGSERAEGRKEHQTRCLHQHM